MFHIVWRGRRFFGDHGVGSTDHFSALKIWMFENKFVSLPSHLKTIEPMEVHRESRTMCNTETSKSDQLLCLQPEKLPPSTEHALEMVSF